MMSIGTGLFFLAIAFPIGCYFLACGIESCGKKIGKGLSTMDFEED